MQVVGYSMIGHRMPRAGGVVLYSAYPGKQLSRGDLRSGRPILQHIYVIGIFIVIHPQFCRLGPPGMSLPHTPRHASTGRFNPWTGFRAQLAAKAALYSDCLF